MKWIELNYCCYQTLSPQALIALHWPSSGYLQALPVQVELIKHLPYAHPPINDKLRYLFFAGNKKFWHIPFATHRYIQQQQPDVVLVQGLVFPLQVIALKWRLGKRTLLIAQHHGERPWRGIKGWLQRQADKCIAAYTFTALGNAEPWLEAGIIAKADKCVEVLEAAPSIMQQDKRLAQQQTGISGSPSFLWVGRLNNDKDPLTVITAFHDYLAQNPLAKLYLIYNQTEQHWVDLITSMLESDTQLMAAVQLVGAVDNTAMAQWYSAADFFIAGSHREGSGYALLEAMHCGCIPVVTDIPTFRKITDNGKVGFLYPPGNPKDLLQVLLGLGQVDIADLSAKVLAYAQEKLSHGAIGREMLKLVEKDIL